MKKYKTLIRFLICGGLTTGVDFILYFCLANVGVPLNVAKAFSSTMAIVCSFFLNRNWTFTFQGCTNANLVTRFALSQVANIVTNTGTNMFVLSVSNSFIFSFISATFAGMTVNYILQRNFVFQGEKK